MDQIPFMITRKEILIAVLAYVRQENKMSAKKPSQEFPHQLLHKRTCIMTIEFFSKLFY